MKTPSNWTVHKFGGTSVANAERFKKVVQIVEKEPGDRKGIVVSAMSGVTNSLIALVELAKSRNEDYFTKIQELKDKHLIAIRELDLEDSQPLKISVENDFEEIKEILRGVWLIKEYSERTIELVSGFGEVWSAQFLNALLKSQGKKSTWIDARRLLIIIPKVNSVTIDWKESQANMDEWLKSHDEEFVVITGFVASTHDGVATTLKRNGSDFSGSIFGSLLNASVITIWTDVDGVLSADPRLVPEAVVLDFISYAEATELAYFGAKVVHPDTMAPAVDKSIPIYIRNTLNAEAKGTKIHTSTSQKYSIKGFSTIDNVALLNIEGTGMIGVPGVANKVFGALKDVGINVIMISQASSEHSICFAVPEKEGQAAKDILSKTFFSELHDKLIEKVEVDLDCSVLAAVGDNMIEHPGIAGQLFSALGKASVNIKAIAQGSSERNISVVVSKKDCKKALRAVHTSFFVSRKTISIGIIGFGLIGGELFTQIKEQKEKLKADGLNLIIRGITNSKRMILAENCFKMETWNPVSDLFQGATELNLTEFVKHVKGDYIPHSVIIDCTSSSEISQKYNEWLKMGINVITPNKKANSGSMSSYNKVKETSQKTNSHFLYETTVGAGLPIINTIKELVLTGDKILEIEGILSGTLSYVFNELSPEKSFSFVVADAKRKGFTEPDPRDDLSGMDVARKLVIVAREMGLQVELDDVKVESLIPQSLKSVTTEEFFKHLPIFDADFQKLMDTAEKNGAVLKYVASISEDGKLAVSLKQVPKVHPFARLTGSDNIVCFKTKRYNKQPLVIQGPGAGASVTAAGVFGDLLRLASFFGT
jgi:aspartokinase/homoserine dehydrogenase 1